MTASSRPSRKKKISSLRKIAEEIRAGRQFLISTHINPEGDAVGSVLALGLALKELGREVIVLTQDPIPEVLAFLPMAEEIVHRAPEKDRFDVAFALDCGDKERLGEEFAKVKGLGKIINIDHHVSNTFYGDMNFIDPRASSVAEIVYDLLHRIPVIVNEAIAENIYVGLLTDTGSFHYSNTSPKTLATAKACLQAGVDPWKMAERVYESQPLARLRLLHLVLGTLEVTEEGRVSSVLVTQKMMADTEATPAMTEDFINFPRSLKGTEVALLFREVSPDQYRVSLRSRRSVNVARIAEEFQGGGHPQAAGCTVMGPLFQVKARVMERVRSAL